MRMSDAARIKGWWFLPESPDDRVPGIFTWSQSEGARLEVIGGLKAFNMPSTRRHNQQGDSDSKRHAREVTIFGVTDKGKQISLWEATRYRYSGAPLANPYEEFWHGPWACIGAHIDSVESTELNDPIVALDNLYYMTSDVRFCAPQWARIEGIDHPGERQDDGTFIMPYILPVVGGFRSNVTVGSTSNIKYRVETTATRPWLSNATEMMPSLRLDLMTRRRRSGPSITISTNAQVRMEHERSLWSAQEILDAINPLAALIRLATLSEHGVEFLRAHTNEAKDVSLLCQLGHESAPDEPIEAGGMVFTFEDLDLPEFLTTWDRLTQSPQAIYAWNIVTGMITHNPRLAEEDVSQVLAAAEGFHAWCLRGGRRLSLRTRLKDLQGRLDEKVANALQLNVEKWSDWAVWVRNHVDHGGAEKHREIGGIHELKAVSDSVRLVTYLATLSELSVPTDRVVSALQEHPRLTALVERCNDINLLPSPGRA